jgi:hypothetical protein
MIAFVSGRRVWRTLIVMTVFERVTRTVAPSRDRRSRIGARKNGTGTARGCRIPSVRRDPRTKTFAPRESRPAAAQPLYLTAS